MGPVVGGYLGPGFHVHWSQLAELLTRFAGLLSVDAHDDWPSPLTSAACASNQHCRETSDFAMLAGQV